MNTLTTETRREKIKEMLQKTDHPVTASSLAEHFSVSRQIIVGDIALLRASGLQILATPRGYLMDSPSVQEDKNLGMIACRHTPEQLRDELYTIVDGGATVVDVTIEHTPVSYTHLDVYKRQGSLKSSRVKRICATCIP